MSAMKTNCENCGAPITSAVCPYCGSPTYTPTGALAGAQGRRVHCWYDLDGDKVCFDLLVNCISTEHQYNTLYGDGTVCKQVLDRVEVKLEAEALDFDRREWAEHGEGWLRHGL